MAELRPCFTPAGTITRCEHFGGTFQDSSRFLSTMRLHQDAAKLLIHECCDVHVQAGLDSMLVQNHGMCSLHVLGAAFHTSNFFLDNQMHQLLHAP